MIHIKGDRHLEITKLINGLSEEEIVTAKNWNDSQNGHSLSGGQRKKLLMMKLLLRYKFASVVILDEIEASLDTETKDIILKLEQKIFSQQKNCIIFKISHETTQTDFYTITIEFNNQYYDNENNV